MLLSDCTYPVSVVSLMSSTTDDADSLTVAPGWGKEELPIRPTHTQLVHFRVRLAVKPRETLGQVLELNRLGIQSDLWTHNYFTNRYSKRYGIYCSWRQDVFIL